MAKENKEGGRTPGSQKLPAPIDTRFLIYYTAIRVGGLKILQPIQETGRENFLNISGEAWAKVHLFPSSWQSVETIVFSR